MNTFLGKAVFAVAATAMIGSATSAASAEDAAADYQAASQAYRQNQIEGLFGARRYASQLEGEFVAEPVTVRGHGYETDAVGNVVVNAGVASSNVIRVECPRLGGRIIVYANQVLNLGYIGGGASTGVVEIDCPTGAASTVELNSNDIENHGIIDQQR